MARIRTVKPDLWKSEQIGEVSIEARLTFIGLITQADDYGRLKGSPKLIRSLVFPYDDYTVQNVSEWLRELAENELIRWFEVGGKQFIELPTWGSHQRVSHPTDSALPSHSDADSHVIPEDSGELPKPPEDARREGKGREGSKEGKGEESEIEPIPDAPLSDLLADLIQGNGAKRPVVTGKWADAERLMVDRDGRDRSEAERLIRWCQSDEFWRGNVLSMPKFREKYDQLLLQAKRSKRSGSPGMSQAEERARAIQRKREARAA